MLCMTCHGALLFSLCAYCLLWSVSLWISVSLLKCWRIIKLQWPGIFSPTFEMERAALKCTEPWTNWWVLAHEIWKSTSHLQVGGGKAVAFQTWSSSVTYTLTVMSRPARERDTQVNAGFLEALALTRHTAWKQLDDLSGTGMFFLQLRLKGLGKMSSVALFLSFWCVARPHV